MASRDKTLPGRPTNSGLALPRAVHLVGGDIGCHQCITSHSGSAPASPDMRQVHQTCQRQLPVIYRGEQGQVYKITKLVSGIYRTSTEENKGKCSRSPNLSAAYTGDL